MHALLTRAISSATLIMFLTLKVFAHELDDGPVTHRDTTMTFMTFVNCDLFNAINLIQKAHVSISILTMSLVIISSKAM
ncbi:hypothetical protein ACHAW6_002973 [Cyclotella cf. meneghiniana]